MGDRPGSTFYAYPPSTIWAALAETPSLEQALLAVDGHVATITLNRQDQRNPLSGQMLRDLIAAIAWNLITFVAALPTSSSHALIFGVIGAALSAHGPDVIIAGGFAIFVLSDFPPTQRFGLVVLAGCIIDILANLFVLPLLGGARLKKNN